MAVCLIAAGALVVALPASAFTLSWTHSVERTVWRETWRVEGGELILDQADISGSGAGMEPPDGATFSNGAWHFRPALPPLPRLRLAHSEFAGDYRLCWGDTCEPISSLVPRGGDGGIEIAACADGDWPAAAAGPVMRDRSNHRPEQGKGRQ